MKAKLLNNNAKNVFLGSLVIMMTLFFYSCAKKATTSSLSSSMIPEASGQVQIKRDVNSNYVIQINLSDLEAVKNLQPAKKAYVVWMVSEERSTKNIGQIEGADTWISKKSKASFEAVSAIKPTKIFITAENDIAILKPGKQIVWSTSSF